MNSMAKDTILHVRVNSRLNKEVDKILNKLGISSSEVINMLFAQIMLRKGLPFPVELPDLPNEETRKALERPFDSEKDFIYDSVDKAMKDEKTW